MNTSYIVDYKITKHNTAGYKAPEDVKRICEKLGFKKYSFPSYPGIRGFSFKKVWSLMLSNIYWLKMGAVLSEGDILLYQHPSYGTRTTLFHLKRIKKKKAVKFIAFIHDLESLRGGIAGVINNHEKTFNIADNELLKQFDVIVCHNTKMKEYLIQKGFISEIIVCLEMFDYLYDGVLEQQERKEQKTVVIAGSLAKGKSEYIYKLFDKGLNNGISVNMFGNGVQTDQLKEEMQYFGSYSPDEIPGRIKGDFGLVWDGNSIDTCDGNTGEYLRFNNPHKLSLYLAVGMPVIVWSQSAAAEFVKHNNVGITVDNLRNLSETINSISESDYMDMKKNAELISEKVRTGYYSERAITKAISICNSNS